MGVEMSMYIFSAPSFFTLAMLNANGDFEINQQASSIIATMKGNISNEV